MLAEIHTRMDAFCKKVDIGAAIFLGCIILLMFLSIFTQIICRYILGNPLSWPEEFTMFLMAWMTFIGSGVALSKWAHIGVDLLLTHSSPRNRVWLELISRVLVLIFSGFLFVEGITLTLESWNLLSDGMRIRMAWPRLAMPIGSLLMCLHAARFMLGDILKLQSGKNYGN